MNYILPILAANVLTLTGCFGDSSFMKQFDQRSQALITVQVTNESGVASGSIDPSANLPQILNAVDEGEMAGTSATFPPGALAIATQVTIQEGSPIATAAFAGSLSLPSGFQATATPVAVTAGKNIDAAKPFTIAIPLPSQSTSLFSFADEYEKLVVTYVVNVVETGETRVGVIPRSMLTLNGKQVQFETTHFGVFQAALTVDLIKEERKAETTTIAVQTKAAQKSLPTMAITGRSPFMVKAGETVTLRGSNFRPTIRLALNGKSIASLNLASDTALSFAAPADTNLGLAKLTADQEGTTQDISLVFDGKGAYPFISEDRSKICSDVQFYDLNGALQTGTRNCSPPAAATIADCSADGEMDCKTTTAFRAAKMANFSGANIASGITVAGIAGTGAGEAHSSCASDGAVGCVTTASYPAANAAMTVASNIKAGITIAGVTGTLSAAPADCSSNGQQGCVTTATYKAADLSNLLAGNVKNGVTIAGTLGTYPSFATPLAGADGTSDLSSLAASTPAGSYEFFDSVGTRYIGSIADAGTITPGMSTQSFTASLYRQFTVAGDADLIAGNIATGMDIFGVAGTAPLRPADCSADGATGCVTTTAYRSADTSTFTASDIRSGKAVAGISGALADCTTDGALGCVTTSAYKAAKMAFVSPGNIKAGVTIAGIAGQYPSGSFPLTGADGTADLDLATFDLKIKNATPFEWFTSSGVRQINNGDADIMPTNIANGVTIFGTTGTIASSACTSDGEIGCMTTAQYVAADTNAYTTWDIRKGKTIGGKPGDIVFYKNMKGTYDNPTAPAIVGVDVWDTVDDYNYNGAFPTTAPAGWDQATGANWVMDPASDTTTVNGMCDGPEACIFKDRITGLMWAKDQGTTYPWQGAITQCDNLNYGSYTDWRLPTQKELFQAYVDGIWSQKAVGKLTLATAQTAAYWSSTSDSPYTSTNALAVVLNNGEMMRNSKSNTYQVICVR